MRRNRARGFYRRYDPRAKLIFTLLMSASVFSAISLSVLYILLLLVLLLELEEAGVKALAKSLRLIMPMLVFMVILMPLQERGGEPLLAFGAFVLVTREALFSVLRFMGRFVFISMMFTLLMQTASGTDILLSLRFFRLPYSASLVLSLALRFIPEINESFERIRESQSLRLPNPGEGEGKKHRIRSLMPTLTSTLVVAFKSVPVTGAALEMRGFGCGKRTSYLALKPFKTVAFQLIPTILLPLLIFVLNI